MSCQGPLGLCFTTYYILYDCFLKVPSAWNIMVDNINLMILCKAKTNSTNLSAFSLPFDANIVVMRQNEEMPLLQKITYNIISCS